MTTVIGFAGDKVALLVRGKTSDTHSPGLLSQHADCAKSDGSPVGLFAQGGGSSAKGSGSGQSSGSPGARNSASTGYKTHAALIGIKGEVYDFEVFQQKRRLYVDMDYAKAYKSASTVLVVTVNNGEADKFDTYWSDLMEDPGTFRLLGSNCSTGASGAFRSAGILSAGIPGLDTPNNLYKQLVKERPDRCTSYSGYVGFARMGNSFALHVDPVEPAR